LPPDDWIEPIVRPAFSVPLMQPGDGIGSLVLAAGIAGEVGIIGMAGAPLMAVAPAPAPAADGGRVLPDAPAVETGSNIMPAAPLAFAPAVAVGDVEAGVPAEPPAEPPELLLGVVPVGVAASTWGAVAAFEFAPSLPHATHANANPSSDAPRRHARLRSASPTRRVSAYPTCAAYRESKSIRLLLGDHASNSRQCVTIDHSKTCQESDFNRGRGLRGPSATT
jgi:hypothetical protein